MQLEVTGRGVKITPAVKAHVEEKMRQTVSVFPRVETVRVVITLENLVNHAEIVVRGKQHLHLDANANDENLYKSIDAAFEKAEKQLRKQRDKIKDHHVSHGVGLGEVEAAL